MKTEKDKYVISLTVESKEKWYTSTYLQNRNRVTDVDNKFTVPGGKGRGVNGKLGSTGTHHYV